MNWIILCCAGLFEVSFAFCLGMTKMVSGISLLFWGVGFLLSTVMSMGLLAKAVQSLPIGTSYAVWTGIGAVGSVLVGIFVFNEQVSPLRIFFLH